MKKGENSKMENRAKITIIDTKTQEEVIVPLILSIDVTKMLVESAINSGLKVIVESVTN